jgi:uncharacterized membrane protein YeiB
MALVVPNALKSVLALLFGAMAKMTALVELMSYQKPVRRRKHFLHQLVLIKNMPQLPVLRISVARKCARVCWALNNVQSLTGAANATTVSSSMALLALLQQSACALMKLEILDQMAISGLTKSTQTVFSICA